ncbi:MAG: response regulator [Rhodoferax sp.]|nr:response regulator [Rhodoferax sp.]
MGQETELAFCSTRAAAVALGVSVSTVIQWVDSGVLTAWKTEGGHRRVSRDSIDALLRQKPARTVFPALRVLVIDDDPFILDLCMAKFAQWPSPPAVKSATNGYVGLFLLGSWKPDLVILDLHMPDMDGFALLRALQNSDQLQQTKIVVISGLSRTAIAERGGLPPGVALFEKPIPFDQLEAMATALAATKA